MSYLHYVPVLVENLTVEENFQVFINLTRQTSAKPDECFKLAVQYLNEFGLQDFRRQRVDKLSIGQMQRIAMIISLITGHELILLDEPFGSIDVNSAKIIIKILLDIKKQNKITFICVSHSNIFDSIADKIYFLNEGVPLFSTLIRFVLKFHAF